MNYANVDTAAEQAVPTEKASVVRLIVQRPSDGAVLLRRFDTIDLNGDDGCKLPSYWSFKGLSSFRIFDGETVTEAVVRVAHRELGIQIHTPPTIVMQVNSPHFSKPILERVYYHTRNWTGDLKQDCDPDYLVENEYQGLHDWCSPSLLGYYLLHPEVVRAARMADKRVGLSEPIRPSWDGAGTDD